MKRWQIVSVVVLVVGTSLAVGPLTPASSQGQPQPTTLTLFDPNNDKQDFEKEIDEGRKGFSPGDWTIFKERQFDAETCEVFGPLVGRFLFVKRAGQQDGFGIFDGTLLGPDGKLSFHSALKFSEFDGERPIFAVVGGTEAYSGAGGHATMQEDVSRCDKNGVLITITLNP